MTADLVPLTLSPALRADALPDGPVALYLAVIGEHGRVLGVAPAAAPRWAWQAGRLCADYGPVDVTLRERGRYACGYLVAVAGERWRPVARIDLGAPPGRRSVPEMHPGETVTVLNALLAWNFSGTENDPSLPPF